VGRRRQRALGPHRPGSGHDRPTRCGEASPLRSEPAVTPVYRARSVAVPSARRYLQRAVGLRKWCCLPRWLLTVGGVRTSRTPRRWLLNDGGSSAPPGPRHESREGPTPVPDRPTTMRQPGAQLDDGQDEPPPGVGRVAIARRTVRPTSQYVGGLCCGQRGAFPERGRRVPPVRARRRATPPTGCGRHGRRGMTMDRGGYVRSTAVQTGRSDVGWSSERWSGHERA
jgi:hypothetical protein